jgi:hypothetical protein
MRTLYQAAVDRADSAIRADSVPPSWSSQLTFRDGRHGRALFARVHGWPVPASAGKRHVSLTAGPAVGAFAIAVSSWQPGFRSAKRLGLLARPATGWSWPVPIQCPVISHSS